MAVIKKAPLDADRQAWTLGTRTHNKHTCVLKKKVSHIYIRAFNTKIYGKPLNEDYFVWIKFKEDDMEILHSDEFQTLFDSLEICFISSIYLIHIFDTYKTLIWNIDVFEFLMHTCLWFIWVMLLIDRDNFLMHLRYIWDMNLLHLRHWYDIFDTLFDNLLTFFTVEYIFDTCIWYIWHIFDKLSTFWIV